MTTSEGTRAVWSELPREVHRAVQSVLGSPVVAAESQNSGFSPGSADRVETASGRRAFVKTASLEQNAGSVDLHRQEIQIMGQLSAGIPAPQLLGSYDRDGWVALIFEDIAGRHPGMALDGSDVTAVLDALASLPRVRGSVPSVSAAPASGAQAGSPHLLDLPEASVDIATLVRGWLPLVSDGGLVDLPTWVRENVDRLQEAAADAAAAIAGDFLVHLDCRADNVLIDGINRVWILDWPSASIGARWLDGLTYLLDGRVRAERIDFETVLTTHDLFAGVPASSVDAVLAGLCGGFLNAARQPAPPSMPTIRDFQRREGRAAADWLRERWGG